MSNLGCNVCNLYRGRPEGTMAPSGWLDASWYHGFTFLTGKGVPRCHPWEVVIWHSDCSSPRKGCLAYTCFIRIGLGYSQGLPNQSITSGVRARPGWIDRRIFMASMAPFGSLVSKRPRRYCFTWKQDSKDIFRDMQSKTLELTNTAINQAL